MNGVVNEAHNRMMDRLPMWVVYRPTTKDYPGLWIARMHLTLPENQATEVHVIGETLKAVRDKLPTGLYRMRRDPNDDPVIEEVWL
jgi:hypothetical protein